MAACLHACMLLALDFFAVSMLVVVLYLCGPKHDQACINLGMVMLHLVLFLLFFDP